MKVIVSQEEKNAFGYIASVVAKHLGVPVRALFHPRGNDRAGYARHLTWYMCKLWMPDTCDSKIALMSKKSRTAVVMGTGKIRGVILTPGESPVKEDILNISKKLKNEKTA